MPSQQMGFTYAREGRNRGSSGDSRLAPRESTAGQVQPVPGPGTGIVTVQGEVDVRRLPPIEVGQRGDWRVSLANAADVRVVNTPAVAIAPPTFLRARGRYEVTWPGGERETFTLAHPTARSRLRERERLPFASRPRDLVTAAGAQERREGEGDRRRVDDPHVRGIRERDPPVSALTDLNRRQPADVDLSLDS